MVKDNGEKKTCDVPSAIFPDERAPYGCWLVDQRQPLH